ncbi:MAG: DUF1326 domain-containing protein [Acidobacteria bacterium]|nr:DUF1326 domain-containing protein [Acidobacteriota bacterium]
MPDTPWRATGLIVENCNCQLLCPGHVSFKQRCTHERCHGHWAIHIDEGRFGDVDLAETNVLIVFDAPARMYDGGWIQACYIDERATAPQRAALDDIVSGRAGGPWAILTRFVETRLETRFVSMRFEDDGRKKRVMIPDLFDTTVTAIRGADDTAEVRIENLHNMLHGPTHVLALGRTRCTDRLFDFEHGGTHALYSRFSWEAGQETPTGS